MPTRTGHGRGESTVESSGDTFLAQDGAVSVEHVVVLGRVGRGLSLQPCLDCIDTIGCFKIYKKGKSTIRNRTAQREYGRDQCAITQTFGTQPCEHRSDKGPKNINNSNKVDQRVVTYA